MFPFAVTGTILFELSFATITVLLKYQSFMCCVITEICRTL